MKKAKKIGKKQIVIAVMVVALGGAIWLNMEYSNKGGFAATTEGKNLGDTQYVMKGEAVETAAKPLDAVEEYKLQRDNNRDEAVKLIEETLNKTDLSKEEKKSATEKIEKEVSFALAESNIETVLKAKGFSSSLAMVTDEAATVIVKKADGLTTGETLQIEDAVTTNTKIPLNNIKIITVK